MHLRITIPVFLFFALPAFAQPRSSADLTILSRSILNKHCAQCHDEKATRTDLKVLDHAQMTKTRTVNFVTPKDLAASQVLELVEQGSMPPGKHAKLSADEVATLKEWIAAGAAAYPLRFDDEFAHATILADAERAGEVSAAAFRYLSLHHLAEDGAIINARDGHIAKIGSVLKAKDALEAIDPTGTIFRLDLVKAGWHHKPFKKLGDDGEDGGPAEGNLFDLVLLEYPHAMLPQKSATFDKLAATFLIPARQVRPFAFVRADWFAGAATTAPLADDLRNLIHTYEPIPPGLEKPMKPAGVADKVTGVPALDAWHGGDLVGESTIKGLKVETIDFSKNTPRSKFAPNDRFRLRISADEPMYYQLLWVDSKGRVDKRYKVEPYDPKKGTTDINLPEEGGLAADELGRERLTVFASKKPFAAGEVWASKHETKIIERFVHPFFALKKGGANMDDAGITRRSVYIDIAKKDD